MSDTVTQHSALRRARDAEGLSREYVARLLDPPVSMKTLERWENGVTPTPKNRLRQLALIYHVALADLVDGEEAA